jgi:dipeptidyl aminopeptidase/acylaminoacyl peptidase
MIFRSFSHRVFLTGSFLAVGIAAALAEPRPMELEDMFRFHRVSDPQVSPDGKSVAYVVTEPLKAENRTNSDIWLVPLVGGEPRQLTHSPKGDAHPRWSPNGKWIAFESNRDGQSQIWIMPVSGGEPRKLTTLSTEASRPVWSHDGKKLAFVSAVFPEFSAKPFSESDRANKEKLEARESSKVKARIFTQLLYRHWDSWVNDLRQHIFVVPVADGAVAGEPRDVTPGENDAVPTSDTFTAGDEYTFSADDSEIVFTAPTLPIREQAWRTNHDLWLVNLTTGERRNLTEKNPAADGEPHFSPDGKLLAYRAQERAGFEADRWQIYLLDRATGERRSLTSKLDLSVGGFAWAPDGKSIVFDADENGGQTLWSVPIDGSAAKRVVADATNSDASFTSDGHALVFSRSRLTTPPEIFMQALGANVSPRAITHTNAALLAPIAMTAPESITVKGAGGTPVQMWVVKPPHFDPTKKYPLVFIVHGGPQGEWNDGWSTRWNPTLWAAQGYVIALPNPRGSTGFGQKFTDEISHDWGGKVYEDLLACLGYLKQQPFVDATRMAAAGASYGGYMMNWINGHTDQFRCIVNHDGVFNFWSMYGMTEEVWFDEWEHGIPWETPDHDRFSPHTYAANFKTPTLIIHSELDFRVPVGEGQQLFTLLQRKGIPSKFLSFPDEGHWVLKPQNSELWHQTVFAWLAEYLKK